MSKKEKNTAHHAPNVEKNLSESPATDVAAEGKASSDKSNRSAAPDSEGLSQSMAALEKRVVELEAILKDNPVVTGLLKVQERIQELESKASEISEKSEKAWGELKLNLTKAWDDLQAKRSKTSTETESSKETQAH